MRLQSNHVIIKQSGVRRLPWDQLQYQLTDEHTHTHTAALSFIDGSGNLLLTSAWLNAVSHCQVCSFRHSWNNKSHTAKTQSSKRMHGSPEKERWAQYAVMGGGEQQTQVLMAFFIEIPEGEYWHWQRRYTDTSGDSLSFSHFFSSTGPTNSEMLRRHMAACCGMYYWGKSFG